MKKILLFVLGAALCACTSKNPDDIVVNVEVENMTVSNVGLLIDRSTSFTIPLDKHGKGRLVITGLGNIYPRVIYGQTAKMAFIGRGEEVTLRFDGRKFKDGFRVEGRNVEANEYLQTMTLPEFNAYDLPWEEFYAEINRLADDAVHLMKARKLEQTCPDFAKVEEARLRYLYAQTMVMYPMGHQLMGGDPDYRPGREVYDAVGKMVVEREDLADVDVYRDFIHFAIPLVLEGQGREFGDPYTRMVATMRYVADNFTDEKVKQTMLRLLANVDLLLATILVVNNLVNICIVILTAGIIDSVFTFLRFEFLFKTVLVTFLLLLFGEILPKVLAQTIPLRFASMVARPLLVLRWVFYPLSYALVRTSSRISEKAAHKSEISLDELADAVDMTQSSSPEEHVMLSGIVNFVNTEVQEIMKPRVDITALSMTADYETVKRTIIESGFSRIPVYEEDVDNIRGTLYVKDLLPYINNGGDFAWQQLIRKPYFVPEHKKINDLLADFQSNKVHMAIVVDEYGSTLGLVSLEDIIEEIVGEISDESDNDECFYTRLDAKSYIFEGKTHLGDFERILDIGEDVFADVRGEAETLAGLMLELKRDFPRKGDVFTSHDLRFTVQEMDGHRVDKIRVDLQ